MPTYALIGSGLVKEIIPPFIADIDYMDPPVEPGGELVLAIKQGDEVPIERRYSAEFIQDLRIVPEGSTVAVGDTYDETTKAFGPPPPAPAPTQAEVLAMRAALRADADAAVAPLQDALDIDEITAAEQALLTKWKKYRVDLNRIEQQPGFPASVVWPVKPA